VTVEHLLPYHIHGRELRWLKTLHICFASIWAGATICIAVIQFAFQPSFAGEMYACSMVMLLIDTWVIAPSALLCMTTGLIYSAMTNFGFIKFWWIIIKWMVILTYITVGFFWLTPWLEAMARQARAMPLDAVVTSHSMQQSTLNVTVVFGQVFVVFSTMALTIIKPWGHTRWHV